MEEVFFREDFLFSPLSLYLCFLPREKRSHTATCTYEARYGHQESPTIRRGYRSDVYSFRNSDWASLYEYISDLRGIARGTVCFAR